MTVIKLNLHTIFSLFDASNKVHLAICFYSSKINLTLFINVFSINATGLFCQPYETFISGHYFLSNATLDFLLNVKNRQ